ncbi:MAG: hypothetical protein D3921_16440 [Candidatus Electrothrix sp. AW1]|nr:hypothetical protein [Candidatus Electrothrix sp. AX1]MCI5184079.1 hypothetical protein [Candidatus Electrothrix gigas]
MRAYFFIYIFANTKVRSTVALKLKCRKKVGRNQLNPRCTRFLYTVLSQMIGQGMMRYFLRLTFLRIQAPDSLSVKWT